MQPPLLMGLCTHRPLCWLQKSWVQVLPSAQSVCAPLLQVPIKHKSGPVHALLSLHAVPLSASLTAQVPALQ